MLRHMMRIFAYPFVKNIKLLAAFAVFVGGVVSLAYAQSVPAIPAIPPPPGLGNIPAIPLPPEMKAIETKAKAEAQAKANPPPAVAPAVPAPASADTVASDTPAIPSLPVPGGADSIAASAVPAVPAVVPPLVPADANTAVPSIPLPGGADGVASTPPPLPIPPLLQATATPPAPAISDAADASLNEEAKKPESLAAQMLASPNGIVLPPVPEKPKVMQNPNRKKTWLSELKPTVKPRDIDFNYTRQLLPSSIYRPSYDRENQHLPVAVTMADYQQWFFMNVAANDIDATRALLNAGVNINSVNANGETALAVAQAHGATDTARLLMARGARP